MTEKIKTSVVLIAWSNIVHGLATELLATYTSLLKWVD